MGQFKPMVKMMTTEPTVELKLKTGGTASHKRMHAEGAKHGFKPVKKMDGGAMGALMGTPAVPMGNPVAARAMAAKRPMMRPSPPARGLPAPGRPPMMPPGASMGRPMMKKGGEVESAADHKMEMKAIKGIGKDLSQHAGKPASKAHKGLKTGGIAKSPKPGAFATGGVVNGQGGFKDGGMAMVEKGGKMVPDFAADGKGKMKHGGMAMMSGGIIMTRPSKTTKVSTAHTDTNSAPTGDVKLGNGGGYKKGGATKKRFATGGAVNNSGHAVAMLKRPASKPVATSQQAGTFKKGGVVC